LLTPPISKAFKGKRRSIMRCHGLRKYALTRMKKAGIDFSDRHKLLGQVKYF
jgi:hypothetical protein